MRHFSLLAAIVALVMAVPAVCPAQESDTLAGSERQAMGDTFQYALENNTVNETSDWVNPDTGHAGTVTPVQTYENAAGQSCREFLTTIVIGGREEQGYGTACRQPDGSWQIVSRQSGESEARRAAAAKVISAGTTTIWYGYPAGYYYRYGYPAGYYHYPAGFYGSSRIFFSFNYVYRDGHRHHGTWYLDGRSFRHRHPLTIHKRAIIGPRIHDRHLGNKHFRGQPSFRGHHEFRGHRDFRHHDFKGRHDFRGRHDRGRHDFRGLHERRGQGPGFWRDSGHGRHRGHR